MLADQVIEEHIAEVVAATVAAGVANVPTETLFEQLVSSEPANELGDRPENRYVPQATVKQWMQRKEQAVNDRGFDADIAARAIEIRREIIVRLHREGGRVLLGSDAPQVFNVPGFSLHRELGLMVDSGLTPYEALKIGTIAPAEFFGLDAGVVKVGKIADLMLLDANPLEDITNSRRVHGVVVRGQWARSSELLERARPTD